MMTNWPKLFFTFIFLGSLASCGGGGDGGSFSSAPICPSNTASACSSPLVFTAQQQYYSGVDGGLPVGNSSRTIDLLINTTAHQYFDSDPYVGDGAIFDYGLCCAYNLLHQPISSNNRRFSIQQQPDGTIYFSNEGTNAAGSRSINDGNWHRVTVTFNGSEIRIYVDGQLDSASGNVYSSMNTAAGSSLRIGESYRGEQWLGKIYRVAVWNYSMDSAQVAAIPNSVDVTAYGLVSYYSVENSANPSNGLRNLKNNSIVLNYATN